MNPTAHVRARQIAVVVLSALALLVLLLTWRLTDPSTLPDRLATHFGDGGRPDGYMPPGGLLATALGGTAVGLAMAVVPTFLLGWQAAMRRTLTGTGAGIAWLMALLYLTTLRDNAGHLDPGTVRIGVWSIVLPLAAGLVVGVVVAVLTPARGTASPTVSDAPDPAELPRTSLRRGQRAVLTSGVGPVSPFVWALLVGLVVLGAVMFAVNRSVTAAVVPIVVALVTGAATFGLSMQVDHAGVRVQMLGLPWPIARARLADIASAEAKDLRPTEWGGWGYRITPHGRAVILRGGPGLVVHLEDGSHLAVSTESARQAAELVNGLLVQSDGR